MAGKLRELAWIGSSLEDLREFPEEVKDLVGYALYVVQLGDTPDCAKPFKVSGAGGAGVMEIVEDYNTDTYRAVYTVRFREIIYVLHCFQKKSPHKRDTAKHDVDLIKDRLKRAEQHYQGRKRR